MPQRRRLRALHALDEGQPLLVCEKNFGVPRNTLRRHWLKTVKKVPGSRHLGRESLLGPVVEADLVQYILMVEERGFGLTPTDVRVLAFDYAESQNIPHKFDKNLKIAGKDWWAGFRLRHRELLSIRKPEGLSISRASAMNRPAIEKYFNVLENEMRRLGLTNKPGCIYNCDESGLSLVPDTCKIVGRKGKKNIYQVNQILNFAIAYQVLCPRADQGCQMCHGLQSVVRWFSVAFLTVFSMRHHLHARIAFQNVIGLADNVQRCNPLM